MSNELVSDELWEAIEPLLPEEPPKPKGGRPRIDDRAALAGIVFVLKSGIPCEMLPKKMGCGSGSTCWRRLRDWQEAGVWEGLHRVLLDRLGEADRIDWERASLDSASVPAMISRTVGLPGLPAVEEWLEPLGLLSLLVESLFVGLWLMTFAPIPSRRGDKNSPS